MATSILTAPQQKALSALLTEPTIQAAAKTAGCGERTLHRWLQEPSFESEYRKARREAVRQAVARLQRSAGGAAAALSEIAEDPNERAPARVAASRAILELAIKAVELEDLEARIAALEQAHANNS
jgi:hypothetical protein